MKQLSIFLLCAAFFCLGAAFGTWVSTRGANGPTGKNFKSLQEREASIPKEAVGRAIWYNYTIYSPVHEPYYPSGKVTLHWRTNNGTTGHGSSIDIKTAVEWLHDAQAKFPGFSYWMEFEPNKEAQP